MLSALTQVAQTVLMRESCAVVRTECLTLHLAHAPSWGPVNDEAPKTTKSLVG